MLPRSVACFQSCPKDGCSEFSPFLALERHNTLGEHYRSRCASRGEATVNYNETSSGGCTGFGHEKKSKTFNHPNLLAMRVSPSRVKKWKKLRPERWQMFYHPLPVVRCAPSPHIGKKVIECGGEGLDKYHPSSQFDFPAIPWFRVGQGTE